MCSPPVLLLPPPVLLLRLSHLLLCLLPHLLSLLCEACAGQDCLSKMQFAKFCKDVGFIDEYMTHARVDLLFMQAPNARTLPWPLAMPCVPPPS